MESGEMRAEEDYEASEGSSEEEAEPKFKYKRILNDISKIFQGDAASCLAIHDKFLALGTQWGRIYVLDHLGNMLPNKVVVAHQVSVNAISIDKGGDYLASCSNDGRVFVYGLSATDYNQSVNMERPIRTVALEPGFGRSGSGQQFVTGDRALVVHERGFFSRDKQQIVYSGEDRDGFISTAVWHGPYIAFANDTGVRLYDRDLRKLITQVKPRHDTAVYRAELHPPSITFLSPREFAVGWAGTVQICAIRDNTAASVSDPGLLSKRVEVCYIWELADHFVAGLSFRVGETGVGGEVGWRELVLLCLCRRDKPDRKTSSQSSVGEASAEAGTEKAESPSEDPENLSSPRVWLVEPVKFDEFELVTEDIVKTRDSEALLPHHYRLAGLPSESLFYLLSSRDMIEVKPCSPDDHLDWLIENQLFKKALDFAKTSPQGLERYTAASVGQVYLEWLLEEGELEEAAELCPKVAGKRKDLWEDYVTRFDGLSALPSLAPYLPTRDPQLEPECYEMVLIAFLDSDVPGFRRLIKEWSPDLYRIGGLITQTLEKLYRSKESSGGTHDALLATLATLYTYERNYERALAIYMNLGDKSVFQLIDRYRLFPQVKDRIRELMDIDTNLAVRLLLENEDSLPAALVMRQLTKQPKLQLAYLNRLFGRNEGAEFADLAVQLYADFEPSKLLSFLRNSEHYTMDRALEICKGKGLVREVVFLLGRSGNRREALRVIISELKDIGQAMDFCKEHDDVDLWEDLITFGVRRPEFVTILLHNVGTHIDPSILIQRIPQNMEIPGLPASLVKLLEDYSLQMALQEGCRKVTMLDAFRLLERLVKESSKGVLIGDTTPCAHCQRPMRQPQRGSSAQGLVDFGCGHGFHEQCLILLDSLSACPDCRAKPSLLEGLEGLSLN